MSPKYLILDIENNNSNRYKRTAGNFLYDDIVAIGLKEKDCAVKGVHIGSIGNFEKFIQETLLNTQLVVGHNIKHDLLFLWSSEELQYMLKNGLKIWDTAQVEYILTGQEHQYPALRNIAVNKYGCKLRDKLMEPYWEKGVQTSDIPTELVLEDVMNDVLDTEQIFLQQLKEVERKGIMPLINIENDMLLFSTELEYNGLYVDQHILKAHRYDLEQKLEQKQEELNVIIQSIWNN